MGVTSESAASKEQLSGLLNFIDFDVSFGGAVANGRG